MKMNFDENESDKINRADKMNRKNKVKYKKRRIGEGQKIREEVLNEEDPIEEYFRAEAL